MSIASEVRRKSGIFAFLVACGAATFQEGPLSTVPCVRPELGRGVGFRCEDTAATCWAFCTSGFSGAPKRYACTASGDGSHQFRALDGHVACAKQAAPPRRRLAGQTATSTTSTTSTTTSSTTTTSTTVSTFSSSTVTYTTRTRTSTTKTSTTSTTATSTNTSTTTTSTWSTTTTTTTSTTATTTTATTSTSTVTSTTRTTTATSTTTSSTTSVTATTSTTSTITSTTATSSTSTSYTWTSTTTTTTRTTTSTTRTSTSTSRTSSTSTGTTTTLTVTTFTATVFSFVTELVVSNATALAAAFLQVPGLRDTLQLAVALSLPDAFGVTGDQVQVLRLTAVLRRRLGGEGLPVGYGKLQMSFLIRIPAADVAPLNVTGPSLTAPLQDMLAVQIVAALASNEALIGAVCRLDSVQQTTLQDVYDELATKTMTTTQTTSTTSTSTTTRPVVMDTQGDSTSAASAFGITAASAVGLCLFVCLLRCVRSRRNQISEGTQILTLDEGGKASEFLSKYTVSRPEWREGEDDDGKIHVVWNTHRLRSAEATPFASPRSSASSWPLSASRAVSPSPSPSTGLSRPAGSLPVRLFRLTSPALSKSPGSTGALSPPADGATALALATPATQTQGPGPRDGAGRFGNMGVVIERSPRTNTNLEDLRALLHKGGFVSTEAQADLAGGRPAYNTYQLVDLYSRTHQTWVRGRAQVMLLGIDENGAPVLTYNVLLERAGQTRADIPLDAMRQPLERGEPVYVFVRATGNWRCGEVVQGLVANQGYEVLFEEEDMDGGSRKMSLRCREPLVRRRFPPGSVVEVYRGSCAGWLRAAVLEELPLDDPEAEEVLVPRGQFSPSLRDEDPPPEAPTPQAAAQAPGAAGPTGVHDHMRRARALTSSEPDAMSGRPSRHRGVVLGQSPKRSPAPSPRNVPPKRMPFPWRAVRIAEEPGQQDVVPSYLLRPSSQLAVGAARPCLPRSGDASVSSGDARSVLSL